MVKYENECVGCDYCMGTSCSNLNVKHLYCDKCKCETDRLYLLDKEQVCLDCLKEETLIEDINE